MHKRLSSSQRGITHILGLVLVLLVVLAIGFAGYKVYKAGVFEKGKTASFNEDISLRLNQAVTIKDGNEVVKFRFTKLEPPSNPDAACPELCTDVLPIIKTEFEYANKKYEGTSYGDGGGIDMSFKQNGAYPLVPYVIELVDTNLKSNGVVRITKKDFINAELGRQFTLKDDGVAALVPGKTGVHISFSICGFNSPCIHDIDYYVNDEYVSVVPFGFAASKASPELQYSSRDGSSVEHNGIRLRLIESDDKTYATFVFEEV